MSTVPINFIKNNTNIKNDAFLNFCQKHYRMACARCDDDSDLIDILNELEMLWKTLTEKQQKQFN